MATKLLENFTKLSFVSLATLPLLKTNYNSMIIILCAVLTITWFLKTKQKVIIKKKYLFLTTPFFLFFIYELLSLQYSSVRVLINLPFLVFPLLFLFRPKFIDEKIFEKSILIFQAATIVQSLIYLMIFLRENSVYKIFHVSNENIPFFREYVSNNYLVEMHPTYFSSFLLISITISLFSFSKGKIFNTINGVISTLFLILFSSRVIILLLVITLVSFVVLTALKGNKKSAITVGSLGLILLLIFSLNSTVKKRFNELITEMNKPVVGDYYNSTNTRMAIYKCDIQLLKEVPFFGFGNKLQTKLDDCYKNNNDSDFYKISVFNTHNYYFNLVLFGGWVFLILFLIYLVVSFNYLKYSILFMFVFFQFLAINLTENYFSRHYGVVLFTYFTSLFIFKIENEKSTTIKHI